MICQYVSKSISFVDSLVMIFSGLGRLPLVNTYARTPPLVWKLGWSPSPTGELKTQLPSLPVDFLLEKDVLKEFVYRINTLGNNYITDVQYKPIDYLESGAL